MNLLTSVKIITEITTEHAYKKYEMPYAMVIYTSEDDNCKENIKGTNKKDIAGIRSGEKELILPQLIREMVDVHNDTIQILQTLLIDSLIVSMARYLHK